MTTEAVARSHGMEIEQILAVTTVKEGASLSTVRGWPVFMLNMFAGRVYMLYMFTKELFTVYVQ